MVFTCFSANLGRHFSKSNNVGHYFCPHLQRFSSDFQGFFLNFPDFQRIKTFVGVFAPPPGPVFSRFGRFLLIGPRAKGGPTLRLLSNTNLHFPSKLLVYSAGVGPSVFKVI